TCPYPWVYFHELTDNDLTDIKLLIDLQMKHMLQDAKDIKGGAYTEDNIFRCGEVKITDMEEQHLNIDTFELSDYVCKPASLNKYIKLYNFVPMGENDGLWFYQKNCNYAACGTDRGDKEYAFYKIPKSKYASVTISDPMTFSASRVWNYICKWLKDNNEKINGIDLGSENTACFAKIYIKNGKEYMSVYVPVL
ncbi:MAG: hypothetical protein K0S55_1690, partial [Clostridia bacterium]|nr:hypothetical protein [Clostridia bacterium]